MAPKLLPVRRRLSKKTTVKPAPKRKQKPLPQPLIIDPADEKSDAKRHVYLVTFPHPKATHSSCGVLLVSPESKTKEEMGKCLWDACLSPIHAHARYASNYVEVKQMGIWREFHSEALGGTTHTHDHAPLLGSCTHGFRFEPVKRALLQRYGLASHWSCSHSGYWSAVRYCAMPSAKKPLESLDAEPWLWAATPPHPPLDVCCHEPITAQALNARRWAITKSVADKGKADNRVTEMDVWGVVVRAGIRNTDDNRTADLQLARYAKEHCSVAMCTFLFKNRGKLNQLIDDIWRWEKVDDVLAQAQRTRMDSVQAALKSPCVCGKQWFNTVVGGLLLNEINVPELCHTVLQVLKQGRSETTPVVVLAGAKGGEGKSMFFKGLAEVFGESVFGAPVKGSFPLVDIENAKVCFLDDWRFDEEVLPWSVQCLWYDGSPVPVARPQNVPGRVGHLLYKGSAPIFCTTPLPDMKALEAAAMPSPATGEPSNTNASMIWRRLKIYTFKKQTPKVKQLKCCGRCFAEILTVQAGLYTPS